MSSYVAVVGKPSGETTCIYGLTPQEVRYLQVKFCHLKPLQMKLKIVLLNIGQVSRQYET